ncbi:hypothetical protein NEOLEDRAFT_1142590 [Neolentinus lepideus HHB14362 ss-1]|uniref:Homeobox domain-containing protein n=1 Tax=Neolentinus lepideus HHB14362 ss-1 TaxID=1314782 RepID=A0A165N259_9AGAM|nr:hypothetical protein NEOLEDRAFT_1142590 [Neolentinus lepideus HHB14362 ss-1]
MDHFHSEDCFHPPLPTPTHNLHNLPDSDQHALYRIPTSQSMSSVAAPGQSSSLYPSVLQQRRPSMEADMYSNSCIPSNLLPPGADPSSVDFRTFYPYVPNEVKHRKRTSRHQLKVLEATFKDETKPNGALRKRLAQQLEMTPRSVQVWFQNRRAKEKTLASKRGEDKTGTTVKVKVDRDSPIAEETSPSPASDTRTPENGDSPVLTGLKATDPCTDSSSSDLSGDSPMPLPLAPRLSLQSASSLTPASLPHGIAPRHAALPDHELQNLRRGSLPTIVYKRLSGPSEDSLSARRRSLADANLARLAAHPYAHVAQAVNNAIYGSSHTPFLRPPSRLSSHSPAEQRGAADAPVFTDPFQRPSLQHRASMPHVLNAQGVYAPGTFARGSEHISPLRRHPSLAPNVAGVHGCPSPDRSPYLDVVPPHALSHRSVPPPIAGPLPPSDYSFGQAQPPSVVAYESNEQLIQDLSAYHFGTPAPREEDEGADDSSSTSYGGSRWGSISSAAGSESSATSANFSEVGSVDCVPSLVEYPQGFHPESRRESCASGFLVAFSGLDVGSSPSAATFASPDVQPADASASSHQVQDNADGSAYPSPGSTVSPGGSPRLQEPATQAIPISRSSELAYALEVKQEEAHASCSDMSFLGLGSGLATEEGNVGSIQNAHYGQAGTLGVSQVSSAPASDSSSDSYEFVARPHKFLLESSADTPSMNEHYSPPMYPEADGYTMISSQPEHYQEQGIGVQHYQPYDEGHYSGSINYSVNQSYNHPLPECSLTNAEVYASYR